LVRAVPREELRDKIADELDKAINCQAIENKPPETNGEQT
jgi:hypothetical protein